MAKVGLIDISRATGYSTATVSNALNHKRNVSEKTAEEIRRVAKEMGYRKRTSVDSIRFVIARKRILSVDESMHHPLIIEGVEDAGRERGVKTTLSYLDVMSDEGDLERAREIVSDPTAGTILLGTEMGRTDLAHLRDTSAHLVLLDCSINDFNFSSVTANNEAAAFQATSYLIERGHRRIGYIAGFYRLHNFQERQIGYQVALSDHGIDMMDCPRVTVGETLESAYEDMATWLSGNPELPTAFFADNDLIAVSAMRALSDAGHAIPEEVSVIGFDDLPLADVAAPPLTTMRTPRYDMGREAVSMLFDGIRTESHRSVRHQLEATLVERGSVRSL